MTWQTDSDTEHEWRILTVIRSGVTGNIMQLVVKSQILAGGRGLGTFKSGLQGGVHIVKTDQVEDLAGNA